MQTEIAQLIEAHKITEALSLMDSHQEPIRKAIQAYDTKQHAVMSRPDKPRRGREDYRTEKLPRAWQEFINEVALFFLLGKPLIWRADEAHAPALKAFQDMLKSLRFDSFLRKSKRLAGSQGLSAKLYRLYLDKQGEAKVSIAMLEATRGFGVRTLFDIWGNLLAVGYTYHSKQGERITEHFDVHFSEFTYRCYKSLGKGETNTAWQVIREANPLGKIPLIIYQQALEWEQVSDRIHRDELTDSIIADTINYFGDPTLIVSADILENLPSQEQAGKVIQTMGANSDIRYLDPPTASELQRNEKENLRRSILQDSFTPDFNFEAMASLGTLSGEAIKRALILGYIKRERNIEIYEPLIDREKNLILTIMKEVTHTHMRRELEELSQSLRFEFAEPFSEDLTQRISDLSHAVSSGILSREQAVSRLSLVDDIERELELLKQGAVSSQGDDAKG